MTDLRGTGGVDELHLSAQIDGLERVAVLLGKDRGRRCDDRGCAGTRAIQRRAIFQIAFGELATKLTKRLFFRWIRGRSDHCTKPFGLQKRAAGKFPSRACLWLQRQVSWVIQLIDIRSRGPG